MKYVNLSRISLNVFGSCLSARLKILFMDLGSEGSVALTIDD